MPFPEQEDGDEQVHVNPHWCPDPWSESTAQLLGMEHAQGMVTLQQLAVNAKDVVEAQASRDIAECQRWREQDRAWDY